MFELLKGLVRQRVEASLDQFVDKLAAKAAKTATTLDDTALAFLKSKDFADEVCDLVFGEDEPGDVDPA
jgi:small ligand-binding sensory domain FIST